MHDMPHPAHHHQLELALHLRDHERLVESIRPREDEQARGSRGEEGGGEGGEPA
jgi:hypothetical protein